MKTPSGTFSKLVATVCLSSMTLYFGTQLVADTSASFTDQESQAMQAEAAFVFPKVIQGLQDDAFRMKSRIDSDYANVIGTTFDLTLKQAKARLNEVKLLQTRLQQDQKAIRSIHRIMRAHYDKAVIDAAEEQGQPTESGISNEIDYVQPAFETVDKLQQDIAANVDMKKVKEVIAALQAKISELSGKEKVVEQAPEAAAEPVTKPEAAAEPVTKPEAETAEPAGQIEQSSSESAASPVQVQQSN